MTKSPSVARGRGGAWSTSESRIAQIIFFVPSPFVPGPQSLVLSPSSFVPRPSSLVLRPSSFVPPSSSVPAAEAMDRGTMDQGIQDPGTQDPGTMDLGTESPQPDLSRDRGNQLRRI